MYIYRVSPQWKLSDCTLFRYAIFSQYLNAAHLELKLAVHSTDGLTFCDVMRPHPLPMKHFPLLKKTTIGLKEREIQSTALKMWDCQDA